MQQKEEDQNYQYFYNKFDGGMDLNGSQKLNSQSQPNSSHPKPQQYEP